MSARRWRQPSGSRERQPGVLAAVREALEEEEEEKLESEADTVGGSRTG
jgi:hypothetical protein